jgi:hypothetical protein
MHNTFGSDQACLVFRGLNIIKPSNVRYVTFTASGTGYGNGGGVSVAGFYRGGRTFLCPARLTLRSV